MSSAHAPSSTSDPPAAKPAPTGEPHVIKRYANRKLYDPRQSRYITLDEIAELIDAGEEVRIIDNKSKEDITRVTLAQVLVEREKQRSREGGPLPALRGLIRNTGEQISRRISEPVNTLRSSVEESVERTREHWQDWVEPRRAELEGFQRWVDDRVKQTVGRLDVLAQLRGQIEVLKRRVEHLEAMVGAGEGGGEASRPPVSEGPADESRRPTGESDLSDG